MKLLNILRVVVFRYSYWENCINRIFSNTKIVQETKCWIFMGKSYPPLKPYPVLCFKGKLKPASRLIAGYFHGLNIHNRWTFALHHCDNPRCVNPSHIYIGDHKQNMLDKKNRNRNYSPKGYFDGENHPSVKLSNKIVKQIRKAKLNNYRGLGIQLAKKYKVSTATICNIWARKSWAHLK